MVKFLAKSDHVKRIENLQEHKKGYHAKLLSEARGSASLRNQKAYTSGWYLVI